MAPRLILGTMSAATGVWAFVLLNRTPDWQPWLRWVVLIGAIVVAVVIAVGVHRLGRATAAVAAAALLFAGAAPAAYAVETVLHAHDGPMAMSGPARSDTGFGGFGGPGGPGGPGASVADNIELQQLVESAENRWAAASIGSMTAGELELQTGASVMAIGGFTGGDNSPTLQQFQDYVADGQVRYFIAGEHRGPGGDSGSSSLITSWVEQNFEPMDVGGATVFDLQG